MLFVEYKDSRKRDCFLTNGEYEMHQQTTGSSATEPKATILLVGFPKNKIKTLYEHLKGCHVEVVRTLRVARQKLKVATFNIIFLNADIFGNREIEKMSPSRHGLSVVAVVSDKSKRSTIKGSCAVGFTKFCDILRVSQCLTQAAPQM